MTSTNYGITLWHHTPEGFWSATAHTRETKQTLGGLFTSAEAALAACWLTTDERIELPGIATYAQVHDLLNARCGIYEDDTSDDAVTVTAVVT
jgi:hypothetical protein